MCLPGELTEVVDPETGNRRPLRVAFGSRSCSEKCLFVLYKLIRMWYVSVYFYFMPFTVFIYVFYIPLMFYTGNVYEGM